MAGTWQWFKPNVAATDYQFKVYLSPSGSSNWLGQDGIGVREVALMDCQYGRPYGSGYLGGYESGFRIANIAYLDPITGNKHFELLFDWPYLNIQQSYTGGGWPNLTSEVRVDQAVLNHNCDAWTFTASRIRWYIHGSTTAYYDSSPVFTHAGVRYRLVENCGVWAAFVDFAAGEFDSGLHGGQQFTPQLPGCPWRNRAIKGGEITAVFGFKWWNAGVPTEEPIEVESLLPTTPVGPAACPSCGCVGTAPTISGTTSYNLQVKATDEYTETFTGPHAISCKCPDGSESGIDELYHAGVEGEIRTIGGRLNSESAGIVRHQKNRSSKCACYYPFNGSEPPNVVYTETNETVTKIAYTKQVLRWTGTRWCTFDIGVCPCLEGPIDCLTCNYDNLLCAMEGVASIQWVDPGCAAGDLHLTTAPNGVMFAVQVEAASVKIWRFNLGAHDESIEISTLSVEYAQVAYGPDGQVHVCYQDGGHVWWISSKGWGENFGTATDLGAGTNPAMAVDEIGNQYVVMHTGAAWRCFRRNYSDATFTNLAVVDTAPAGVAALEWSPDLEYPLVFMVESGGVIWQIESPSRGESWLTPVNTGVTGITPAFAVSRGGVMALAVWDGAAWNAWRRAPKLGTWEEMGEIATYVADWAGLEFHPDQKHRLVFVCSDTARRRKVSTDHGTTWEDAI